MIFQPGKCWETLEESLSSMNHTSADQPHLSEVYGAGRPAKNNGVWRSEILQPKKNKQNHQTWKFWRELWYGWALRNRKKGSFFFQVDETDGFMIFFSPKKFERIEQNIGKESSVVNASEFHHFCLA